MLTTNAKDLQERTAKESHSPEGKRKMTSVLFFRCKVPGSGDDWYHFLYNLGIT